MKSLMEVKVIGLITCLNAVNFSSAASVFFLFLFFVLPQTVYFSSSKKMLMWHKIDFDNYW